MGHGVDELFGHAIAEVLGFGIAGGGREGQHRDGSFWSATA